MGRQLKRVPLDFDHPLEEAWVGYDPDPQRLKTIEGLVQEVPELAQYEGDSLCDACERVFTCEEGANHCILVNKGLREQWYYDPPEGEGYQLWENVSVGSPITPVFETLEALCEWCAENETTFASFKATKEQWMEMLSTDSVKHTEGNITYI